MTFKPVGCDVSQKTIDCFIPDTGEYIKITNDEKGFKHFINRLPEKENLHICMEATGNYHEEFADYLALNGYKVSVVNPLKIHNFAKSEFNRTKTDKQDAKIIASYCEKMKPPPNYQAPTEQQYEIKRLINYINQLNKQKRAIKNRIKTIKDGYIKLELHNQLKDTNQYIKRATKRLTSIKQSHNQNQTILTIPSIGRSTAAILTHYLTFFNFETENDFIAFAGLCPDKEQSGTSVNKPDKLTKFANRTLRTALYMPAVVAYRIGLFRKFVERMKRKGKHNKVILIAIMRKLAALAYTLFKKGESFKIQPSHY